jgi:hypothetical protein
MIASARAIKALEVLVRLPALRLRLGRDQVGEPFDRGPIHAAVFERAAGEFAGLGLAQAVELSQRRENRRDHGAAAVDLQLGRVLAGLAVRPGEPQHQAFIDGIAACGIAHARQRRASRLRHPADHLFQREARARTTDANDRDRRRRSAGGEGEDGVSVGGHVLDGMLKVRPNRAPSRQPSTSSANIKQVLLGFSRLDKTSTPWHSGCVPA